MYATVNKNWTKNQLEQVFWFKLSFEVRSQTRLTVSSVPVVLDIRWAKKRVNLDSCHKSQLLLLLSIQQKET